MAPPLGTELSVVRLGDAYHRFAVGGGIRACPTVAEVGIWTTVQGVVPVVADEFVVALLTVEPVIAIPTDGQVVA